MKLVLGQYISYNTKVNNPQVLSFIKDKIIIVAAKFIYKRNESNKMSCFSQIIANFALRIELIALKCERFSGIVMSPSNEKIKQ